MRKLKKVDRVNSVEEALQLQNIGVDIVGISMNSKSFWKDDRLVSRETALAIRKVLDKSKLACEVELHSGLFDMSIIDEIGLDYVQVSGNDLISIEFRRQLQAKNIGIIYSGIEASYEDDPSWILSRFEGVPELNAAYYQIDLLGDIENSWEFFKNESPNYPDELQINDIVEIGEKFPVIITLDFDVNNVKEVIKNMPSIQGICMPLGETCSRNDIHYFDNMHTMNVMNSLENEE